MNTEKFQPLSAARLRQIFFGGTAVCIQMHHGKMETTQSLLSFYVHQYKSVELHYVCEEGSHTSYDCNCIWSSRLGAGGVKKIEGNAAFALHHHASPDSWGVRSLLIGKRTH